ncbi:MAG: Na+/H+ antiporter subunit E, partial [Acidimicrobiia bacterium]
MHRVTSMVWLTAVWVMLWESLSWANVLGGLAVAALVMVSVPSHKAETPVGFRPVAAVRLLGYFLWKLTEASARLTWEIFTPRNKINAAVVCVPLRSRVPGIVTAVANMVSLTPGSVTIEVDTDDMTLYIHVLHLTTLEQERESVRYLESLTLAAFPPSEPDTLVPKG